MNVERDNIKFMREKERSAASSLYGASTSTGGGGGSSDGLNNSINRYILLQRPHCLS
jgi:hypothetical protein